jgi:hypothetical protein
MSIVAEQLVQHWPFRSVTGNTNNTAAIDSKSLTNSHVASVHKATLFVNNNDTVRRTRSQLRLNPTAGLIGKYSVDARQQQTQQDELQQKQQQRAEWSLKAQEGIITYRLPDGQPDGLLLQTKLQQLMKTDTIHLNHRQFWTQLENRFKALRKVST